MVDPLEVVRSKTVSLLLSFDFLKDVVSSWGRAGRHEMRRLIFLVLAVVVVIVVVVVWILGPTFALGLLGGTIDQLGRLVLTMPYLPSEGTLYLVKDLKSVPVKGLSETLVKYGHDVRIYTDFPSLWTKYTIPDSLREYWFTKKPYITEFLIRNYYDLGIDFLPNHVLKDYYEILKNESLTTSLNHFDDLSTALLCFNVNILSLNFLHL